MKSGRRIATALLLCALTLATAGCGEWHGSKEIDTVPPGEREGGGPGLFSGKEGGFVIYQDVWSGSAPGEHKPPE